MPHDISELADLALAEGHRHLCRLVDEFETGENCFSIAGEGLFVATIRQRLVGIGGLNIDPYVEGDVVARARRVYVHPDHRRQGVANALMDAIEALAQQSFDRIQLYTSCAVANRFYLSRGYERVADMAKVSHIKRFPTD